MPPSGDLDLHHLVLLYLAVAYQADGEFDPVEHQAVLNLLMSWVPGLSPERANRIVTTALMALQKGQVPDIDALAREVGATLSPEFRRRVLADLGRVARADGVLSVGEARMIRRVRVAMESIA